MIPEMSITNFIKIKTHMQLLSTLHIAHIRVKRHYLEIESFLTSTEPNHCRCYPSNPRF